MPAHVDLAALTALAPRVLAATYLVAMMAQLGLELEPVEDRAAKRRQRRLILRALVFNFVVVPGIALAAARGFGATGPIATALLLLAASPGGRYAPMLVKLARGDVGLSVEITLFVSKLNSIISPLLAVSMIGTHHISIHELTYVVQIFVLQFVPYFGARQLRKWRPQVAAQLARPTGIAATAAALALLAYLIAHHELRSALFLGVRGWLAVLVFGMVALALGWLAGGRDARERRAFAVAAEARNLALALVLANLAVGDPQVLLATFGAWLILLALGAAAAALPRMSRAPAAALR